MRVARRYPQRVVTCCLFEVFDVFDAFEGGVGGRVAVAGDALGGTTIFEPEEDEEDFDSFFFLASLLAVWAAAEVEVRPTSALIAEIAFSHSSIVLAVASLDIGDSIFVLSLTLTALPHSVLELASPSNFLLLTSNPIPDFFFFLALPPPPLMLKAADAAWMELKRSASAV